MDWMTIGIMDLVFMIVASENEGTVSTVVGGCQTSNCKRRCGVDASSFSEPAGEDHQPPANQSLW